VKSKYALRECLAGVLNSLLLFVIPLKISKFETNEDVLCCVATNGDS